MKLKFFQLLLVIFILSALSFSRVSAACSNNPFPSQASGTIEQVPLFCSSSGILQFSINLLLGLAASAAILFIILGGFWYMTAGANAEQAEKGRKALMNAVIGLVVIILSFVIVRVVLNLVT